MKEWGYVRSKWLGLSAAMILALSITLAACSRGSEGPQSSQPPAGQASPTVDNKELVIGYYRDFTILDPHRSSASLDALALHAIFDRLIEINGDNGKMVPGLATEWKVSADGLVWTLKLRQGVKFHDGTPFNAAAVKANFDRIADPKTMSEYAVFQLGPYKETKVVDEYTAEVHMTEKYGAFPTALATYGLGMVSPAAIQKYGEKLGENPVGTGPFSFVEWVPKSHLTLKRNPDYNWAPEFHTRQSAFFETIIIKTITEDATRAVALERGEIDAAGVLGAPQFMQFAQEKNKWGTEQFLRAGYPPPGLFINVKKFPTDDLAVRKALIQAVDTLLLNEVVYEGTQQPSGGVISSHVWGYSKEAGAMYKFDKAQAAKTLDDAGWRLNATTKVREKDGKQLEIVYLSLSGVKNVAEVIEPMLREIGFKVTLKIEDNPAQQKSAQSGAHNLVWTQWGGVDPSQLNQVYACQNIGSGWNFAHYCNQRFEDLMKQGSAETDPAKREQIYKEVQQLLMADATIVPLNNQVLLWAFEKDLKGWRPTEATGFAPYLINVHR